MIKKLLLLVLTTISLFALNFQTASKSELMSIKGIGEKRADAIIKYRKSHKIKSAADLENVPGIGKEIANNAKKGIKNANPKKPVNKAKKSIKSKTKVKKESTTKVKKTKIEKKDKSVKKAKKVAGDKTKRTEKKAKKRLKDKASKAKKKVKK